MTTETQIPAIVIGGGVTALGVLRALNNRDIPAYSTAAKPDLVAYSNTYRACAYKGAPLFADLSSYLDGLEFDRAVLIPCADSAIRQVAALDSSYHERFPSSTPTQENLSCYLDKKTMYETAAALKVPHPRTVTVDDAHDLQQAFAQLDGDIFLKPRNSERFFSKFGVKAVKISADQAGLESAEKYLDSKEPLLVQEYIGGGADQHLFIDGFVDRDGIFRSWFLRRRMRMYPPLFGNSSYMRSIDFEDEIEAVRTVQLYLEGTHFRGVFSAELKKDPSDELFKLIEINPRPWWFISFAEQCGVPISMLAYRDALGLPLETVRRYKSDEIFIHPYYDFFACLELYKAGQLTLPQWASSWGQARHSFISMHDLNPQLKGAARFARGVLRHLGRTLKGTHATK